MSGPIRGSDKQERMAQSSNRVPLGGRRQSFQFNRFKRIWSPPAGAPPGKSGSEGTITLRFDSRKELIAHLSSDMAES